MKKRSKVQNTRYKGYRVKRLSNGKYRYWVKRLGTYRTGSRKQYQAYRSSSKKQPIKFNPKSLDYQGKKIFYDSHDGSYVYQGKGKGYKHYQGKRYVFFRAIGRLHKNSPKGANPRTNNQGYSSPALFFDSAIEIASTESHPTIWPFKTSEAFLHSKLSRQLKTKDKQGNSVDWRDAFQRYNYRYQKIVRHGPNNYTILYDSLPQIKGDLGEGGKV